MSCSWLSQQNKFTFVRTFCFPQSSPSPGWGSDLDVFAFSELPVVQTIHSTYSVVLDFYRICLIRTATGMKPASTASSARIPWWTNLLLQKRNIYFVLTATPMNTLPNVMSARRLLCQVRMLTNTAIFVRNVSPWLSLLNHAELCKKLVMVHSSPLPWPEHVMSIMAHGRTYIHLKIFSNYSKFGFSQTDEKLVQVPVRSSLSTKI